MSTGRRLDEARTHGKSGRWNEAAAACRRILRANPDHDDALVLLAEALERLGRIDEAVVLIDAAWARRPRAVALLALRADLRQAKGALSEAVAAYQEAVAVDSDHGPAWWGLACAQAGLGDHVSAAESFRRLVEIQPGHGLARHNLGQSLFKLGQVDAAVEAWRASIAVLPPEARGMPLSNIAVAIPGAPSATNRDVLEARREFASACLPPSPDRFRGRAPIHAGAGRLIRVGYVSGFFDKRNWMKPVWGLVNRHDRGRFEVHLISDTSAATLDLGYRPDPRDRFHDVSTLSAGQAARRIEELGIDVLVDLNGYSKPARLPIFALRPAPVQVAWFNMFATSGMAAFDALIGDAHVVPPEEEPFHTEPVERVSGSYLTFEVAYPVPDVAPPPCLARDHLTFGCLAPQYKITTEVVAAWSRILLGAPGSRLLLKNAILERPTGREFVLGLFKECGIGPERLELEGPAEHFAFLERYAEIDVALDTFPYNGGTTTTEAIWQGVPVLTFHGGRWASRTSATILREGGLGEFVADDLDGFVARGIALANDRATPARLSALRASMRDKLRGSSVCDAAKLAREIEAIFERLLSSKVRDLR